jgi:glutathione peroxidase
LNGWNSQDPVWNFSKYLVNEDGKLGYVFGPSVDPLDPKFVEAVKK